MNVDPRGTCATGGRRVPRGGTIANGSIAAGLFRCVCGLPGDTLPGECANPHRDGGRELDHMIDEPIAGIPLRLRKCETEALNRQALAGAAVRRC